MAVQALAIAAAVAKLGGGLAALSESNEQAKLARAEARRNAKIEADAVRKQLGENYAQLAKSGVSLQGSPLLVLEENIKVGTENVQDILRQGKARADEIKASGRAALFSSIASAGGSLAGGK